MSSIQSSLILLFSLTQLLLSSRIGLQRIDFKSYKHDQLKDIIESRFEVDRQDDDGEKEDNDEEEEEDEGVLTGNVMDKDSVQMCVRKVASVSGDARKALDICR